jgi:5-methylcytosine-specific restriction endonuclease McrA
LLRADPHRWGSGLVHQIDTDRDQLMCGKTPANCPGNRFDGTAAEITCKACLRSIAAKIKYEKMQADWARQDEEAAARRDVWWQYYNAYLLSPVWRNKRALVLRRAGGVCEGCGAHGAAQVHHLRYPQECWPGSEQWIAQEKLFDLRAVCLACHDDIHSRGRTP